MYSILSDYPIILIKGGEGSGHFEHEGRPGEVGGSAPSGGGASGGGSDYLESGTSEYEEAFSGGFSEGSEFIVTSLAEGGYRTRGGEAEYEADVKSAKVKVAEQREKAVKVSRFIESKGKDYTVWFPKSVMEKRQTIQRGKPEYILKDKFAANMDSFQNWFLKAK